MPGTTVEKSRGEAVPEIRMETPLPVPLEDLDGLSVGLEASPLSKAIVLALCSTLEA